MNRDTIIDQLDTNEKLWLNYLIEKEYQRAIAILNENKDKFQEKYGDQIPVTAHPLIRNEAACYLSSSKAVALAKNSLCHVGNNQSSLFARHLHRQHRCDD